MTTCLIVCTVVMASLAFAILVLLCLGFIELTKDKPLEWPVLPPIATSTPTARLLFKRPPVQNKAVTEAVIAALKDFERPEKTSNPYAQGQPQWENWAHNYQRVTHDQMHAAANVVLAQRMAAAGHSPRTSDMTAIVDAAHRADVCTPQAT